MPIILHDFSFGGLMAGLMHNVPFLWHTASRSTRAPIDPRVHWDNPTPQCIQVTSKMSLQNLGSELYIHCRIIWSVYTLSFLQIFL